MKPFTIARSQPSLRRSFWHSSSIAPLAQLTVLLDFQPYRWVSAETRTYLLAELRTQGFKVLVARRETAFFVTLRACEAERMLALVELVTGVKLTQPKRCREIRYRQRLPMERRFAVAERYSVQLTAKEQ